MDSQNSQTASGADVRLSLGSATNPIAGLPDRYLERFAQLSLNQKVMAGFGALALVIALWASVSTIRSPSDYRVLYSNLSEGDGAAILAALQQANVPYKFTDGGGAIMVPQKSLYETRLKLAGQGLPKAGNVGFELLDNQKFGTSQFVEQVNYVRALEGELARSIASLEQVKSARVHLAIPKQTAFVREREDPTASVVVELLPGRGLDDSQTAAIARLVSTSVPRLQSKNVSIVDTEGALLAPAPNRTDGLDASQLRYTGELQNALNQRLASLLEPIAGRDGFRTQVFVDVDFDERERTSETFGKNASPEGQSLRSRQSLESQGASTAPGGIPGSLTNQPPLPAEAPIVTDVMTTDDGVESISRDLVAPGPIETGTAVSESPSFRRESTENFEVDRVIERLKASKGQIKRLTAAVVLDNKLVATAAAGTPERVPFTDVELAEINRLVRDAIGFVEGRGDNVSVVNIPFTAELKAEQPILTSALLGDLLRYAAIALALLLAYYTLIRPFLRAAQESPSASGPIDPFPPSPAIPPDPLIDIKLGPEPAIAPPTEPPMPKETEEEAQRLVFEQLLEHAKKFATEKPEEAALLLRAWLNDKGRESI